MYHQKLILTCVTDVLVVFVSKFVSLITIYKIVVYSIINATIIDNIKYLTLSVVLFLCKFKFELLHCQIQITSSSLFYT